MHTRKPNTKIFKQNCFLIFLFSFLFFICLLFSPFIFLFFFLFSCFFMLCSFVSCLFHTFMLLTKLPQEKPDTWVTFSFYWLLKHPVFYIQPFSLAQSVRPHLVYYNSVGSTYVTHWMTSCSIGHQVIPIQPLPREAEDFSRGIKDFFLPINFNSCNQKVLVGTFYLCIRVCYGTSY